MPNNKGMDWIRIAKRMAIYARDGFRCIWCKVAFEDDRGYGFTLDHVYVDGSNEHHNLVTCCASCNSSRQRLLLADWLTLLKERTWQNHESVAHRVLIALGTPLNMEEGRRLALARRPGKKDDDGSSGTDRAVAVTKPEESEEPEEEEPVVTPAPATRVKVVYVAGPFRGPHASSILEERAEAELIE